MRIALGFLFLVVSCSSSLLGQRVQWSTVLPKLEKLRQIEKPNPEKVAAGIKLATTDPAEKAALLHAWVASYLNYSLSSPSQVNEDDKTVAERACKSQIGVCLDYAKLYVHTARLLGLESVMVVGYSKPDKKKVVDTEHADHAWVLVKVADHWRIADPTWSGTGIWQGARKAGTIDTTWYDIEPHVALVTHLPAAPMFQLLDRPMSMAEFLQGKTSTRNTTTQDWTALIAQYQKLPTHEAELFMARQAYAFYPENEEILGIALTNYGVSKSTTKAGSITSKEEAQALLDEIKVLKPIFQEARDLLSRSTSEISHMNLPTAERNLRQLVQNERSLEEFVRPKSR